MWRNVPVDMTQRVSPRELPERMDGECSYEEYRDCLRSLEWVNFWSLGHRPTLNWLERRPYRLRESRHILDVGSGGGGLLRKIARWASRRKLDIELTGIDLNPYAALAASQFTPGLASIKWLTGDVMLYKPDAPIDIAVSSLMAHHLEDEEIVALLRWLDGNVKVGWFINDLERSELSFRVFPLLPWHPMVRHDGPVSFRRAFRREDWLRLIEAADIPLKAVTVEHWRPGRLCVGRWK